jgi:hypothetical protein
MFNNLSFVHYIPAVTTLFSAIFLYFLVEHYLKGGRKPHILWWSIGIFTYGLGTALEASITIFGNSLELTKAWYIAGAILGGYPLAQGSVYLHLSRKTANILSFITVPFIIFTSIMIIISPTDASKLLSFKPSGNILEWQWVRLLTPFINIYSVIFLIGGAIYSSVKYFKKKDLLNRAVGNALIAFGAILPGIGGAMAKAGMVEALYIGEFLGIIFIWIGYRQCINKKIL